MKIVCNPTSFNISPFALSMLIHISVYSLIYLCPSTRWEHRPSMKALHCLRHDDNFLPGVPHLLHFRLHVSPPGVFWPSYFPLPLGFHVRACDARWRFSQRVTNPTPFTSYYLYFYWQLIIHGPQSVVADFV